jgi:hypothetical protein
MTVLRRTLTNQQAQTLLKDFNRVEDWESIIQAIWELKANDENIDFNWLLSIAYRERGFQSNRLKDDVQDYSHSLNMLRNVAERDPDFIMSNLELRFPCRTWALVAYTHYLQEYSSGRYENQPLLKQYSSSVPNHVLNAVEALAKMGGEALDSIHILENAEDHFIRTDKRLQMFLRANAQLSITQSIIDDNKFSKAIRRIINDSLNQNKSMPDTYSRLNKICNVGKYSYEDFERYTNAVVKNELKSTQDLLDLLSYNVTNSLDEIDDRVSAAHLLVSHIEKFPKIWDVLMQATEDSNAPVRAISIYTLLNLLDTHEYSQDRENVLLEKVILCISNDRSFLVRRAAAECLVWFLKFPSVQIRDTERILFALVKAINYKHDNVGQMAIQTLAGFENLFNYQQLILNIDPTAYDKILEFNPQYADKYNVINCKMICLQLGYNDPHRIEQNSNCGNRSVPD